MSELILYTSEDGASHIQLRADGQTVWLTQREMAELFDVSADNISLHLKNIFSDNESEAERTTEESSVVQQEARAADAADEAELAALESKIKKRPRP